MAGVLLAGCASQEPPVKPLVTSAPARASAALAFDPPITLSEPPIDLSRDVRGPAAFAGFEDSTTTYFYINTDDRQTTDQTDRFAREAYIAKVGATRR